MSFSVAGFRQYPYSGTPSFVPLADDAGGPVAIKPPMGKRGVPLSFNWLIYFARNSASNIAVPINLQGGNNTGGLLDKIRAVKIDNTNSLVPVTVYFPDTKDLIVAAPNTIVQGPVMTNQSTCIVMAQGLSAGAVPTTNVYLYNFHLPAFNDAQINLSFPQWIGSPAIQRANALTPGFGPPALGDQVATASFSLVTAGSNLILPQMASGFYYLTSVFAQATGFGSPVGTSVNSLIWFQSDIGDVLWQMIVAGNDIFQASATILQMSGMNIRIPATTAWRLNDIGPGGFNNGQFNFNLVYSYQP